MCVLIGELNTVLCYTDMWLGLLDGLPSTSVTFSSSGPGRNGRVCCLYTDMYLVGLCREDALKLPVHHYKMRFLAEVFTKCSR